MIPSVEAKIHFVQRQREIKLFLRLRKRVGVGSRRAPLNFLRNPQVARQFIYLGFVKMSYRLDIRRAVAILDKNTWSYSRRFGVPATANSDRRSSTPSFSESVALKPVAATMPR